MGGEERGGGGGGMVCIRFVSSSLDNTPKTLYPNEKVIFLGSSLRLIHLILLSSPRRLLVKSYSHI